MSENAISAALIREEDRIQRPVYYISKRLTGAERNYPKLEKLAYCLVIASRKLRPYFQAHHIIVYTDQPSRHVLTWHEMSGRLPKWNIELSQFDIAYTPRQAIQGQVLADFIAEFTIPKDCPRTVNLLDAYGNSRPMVHRTTAAPTLELYLKPQKTDPYVML